MPEQGGEQREQRRKTIDFPKLRTQAISYGSSDALVTWLILQEAIDEADLTGEQQEALILTGIEGYSSEDAAEIVGVNAFTMRGRRHRAIEKIKDVLAQWESHEEET